MLHMVHSNHTPYTKYHALTCIETFLQLIYCSIILSAVIKISVLTVELI